MSDPRRDSAADSPRPGPLVGRRTLAFVVALVALELVLKHAFGYGWWTVTEQSERYGWRMLPHQAGRSRDLTVAEDINGWGFRDREWPTPVRDADGTWVKDPDVYRVAMVGNSMTYGTSVPIEDSYGRQLERLLQERLDAAGDPRRVVVMNFAVQGYVFEQMARVYDDLIRRWRPDLMVVPFHPHDVMPMRPAVDDADYDLRTWVLRTATYDWLNRHVINHWLPRVPPPPKERGAIDWDGLDLFITQQPFDKANRPWWDQARERMEQLRQTVEADGGRLLICSLPRWRKIFRPRIHGAELTWRPWAWERRESVLHCEPFPRFREAMTALAAEMTAKGLGEATTHDLSTLTWTDAQGVEHPGTELDHGAESPFLLDDMGHYTALGHRLVAEALRDTLVEAGLP